MRSKRNRRDAARRLCRAIGVLLAFLLPAEAAREASDPPLTSLRLAVFPVDNLSARAAPLRAIRDSLVEKLARHRISLLEEADLRTFMARERVRHVGGISSRTGLKLWDASGTNVVLITHLVEFDDGDPPRVDLLARLVEISGPRARILWATSIPLAGDDAPGFLGLGLVGDPQVLLDRATSQIADGVLDFVQGVAGGEADGGRSRRPGAFHRSPEMPALGAVDSRVAVLPFSNDSVRRGAGEIVGLRFTHGLVARGAKDVVEPADVRETLLETRLIQEGGLSLPQSDLLRNALDAQLVFTGTVFDYVERGGMTSVPELSVTALGIDAEARRLGWIAFCYHRGDDGLEFFDVSFDRTIGRVTDGTVRGLLERLARP